MICDSPDFHVHSAELQGNASLALQLAELLLPALVAIAVVLQLPPDRQPAGCSWNTAAHLAAVLSSNALSAAMDAWGTAADDSAASSALLAAAQLVQHLPLQQMPPGMEPDELPHLMRSMMTLLGCLSVLFVPAETVLARQSGAQHRQHARHLLAALAQLPTFVQLLAACKKPAALLWLDKLYAVVSWSLRLLARHLDVFCPPDQLDSGSGSSRLLVGDFAQLCTCVASALRALPLMAEARQRLGMPTEEQHAAHNLSMNILTWAAYAATMSLDMAKYGSYEAPGDTISACQTAQWLLHLAVCRTVRWAAASASNQRLLALLDRATAEKLHQLLAALLAASWELDRQLKQMGGLAEQAAADTHRQVSTCFGCEAARHAFQGAAVHLRLLKIVQASFWKLPRRMCPRPLLQGDYRSHVRCAVGGLANPFEAPRLGGAWPSACLLRCGLC
jgi:hypothetical protein